MDLQSTVSAGHYQPTLRQAERMKQFVGFGPGIDQDRDGPKTRTGKLGQYELIGHYIAERDGNVITFSNVVSAKPGSRAFRVTYELLVRQSLYGAIDGCCDERELVGLLSSMSPDYIDDGALFDVVGQRHHRSP